jgi:hypothetical protein
VLCFPAVNIIVWLSRSLRLKTKLVCIITLFTPTEHSNLVLQTSANE